MPYKFCKVLEPKGTRFGGHLLVVTLNRPAVRNALHNEAHAELSRVFDYFDRADHLWCAILTGAGSAFCAGFDLKSAMATAGDAVGRKSDIDPSAEPDQTGCRGGSGFAGLAERRGRIKPIIAAVNGVAHGGGFEAALACDIIVAAERADFALPEPRVGLVALAGGMIRLPRLIGYHAAMEMMLTARRVSALEGQRLGFVQRVVLAGSSHSVVEEAMRIVDAILKCSPDSIQATVEVARRSLAEADALDSNDAITLQRTYPTVERLYDGSNVLEGPAAFAEKRAPNWGDPESLSRL